MTNSNSNIVPLHLGIIMDGNRRWARQQGRPTLEGHRRGLEVLNQTVKTALERGVKVISAYVFSTENWSRTEKEVNYLMGLAITAVEDYLEELHQEGIRVVVLGRRDGLRQKVLDAIGRAEAKTAANTEATLALCFNYGGHDEIVHAAKQLVNQGRPAESIDTETIRSMLYEPNLPDVDLMIRTSGEQRTSGFMLWRSAYAELYFSDVMWPDFDSHELDKALADYARRQRRFGK